MKRLLITLLVCATLGSSIGVNIWQYRHRLVAVIVIRVPAGPCEQST
ncbi:MAG: hypothetical protein KGL39_48715 [Patescibacteria group bacterium]|nr:hypothetical protein [Patescibacteria group bacterium]